MNTSEYPYKSSDLAAEFDCTPKTVTKKAKALSLGIDLGGRAGYRYSEADRRKLIESMRPAAPTPKRRKRRAA